MSSTNPQDVNMRAYHTKIESLLQKLEQDITSLEAHFRSGPSKYTYPTFQSTYTPAAPYLPAMESNSRYGRIEEYTPYMPIMPEMYVPTFRSREEEVRDREKGGEPVGSGDGEQEEEEVEDIYDPANPIMDIDLRTRTSRPYDFRRYLSSRQEDVLVPETETGVGITPRRKRTEIEFEVPECVEEDDVVECLDDEIGYEEEEDEEEDVIAREAHPRAQDKSQLRNQENEERETIESENPSTEKF
ncbi:hypothetical protein VTL71DRAFT_15617 [Oculimacula yallundae]|uniref:Uncharacterized protein n=1 Tax=Oculimacula yallundae TaxID=86028 RepID=A0ABR4CH35_9HELO